MIKNILSDERYEYFKDKVYHHPFVSNYNFWGWFREQKLMVFTSRNILTVKSHFGIYQTMDGIQIKPNGQNILWMNYMNM